MEKRPALGKGLSALIPDAPEPHARADRSRHRSPDAQRLSAARADRRRAARRAGAIDQDRTASSSRSSSARSATGFRSSPANAAGAPRRRAGLLRVPVVVREVAPTARSRVLEMALIENIQRENLEPDRRSARVPAAGRRVPPDAGAHRRRGRQGSLHRRQHAAPAEAARRSAAPRSRRDGCRWDTRARCSRCDGAATAPLARDIIARSLSVRETESLVKKAIDAEPSDRAAKQPKPRRRAHARGRGKAASAARHARAHRAARARRDGSRSTSSARTN